MDWILENLGKFISLIVFVFYILSTLKARGVEDEEEVDPEAEERARRIQEEIRRKILERQQGGETQPSNQPMQRQVEKSPTLHVEKDSAKSGAPSFNEGNRGDSKALHSVQELESAPAIASHPGRNPFAVQRREIEEQLQKAKLLREQTTRAENSKIYDDLVAKHATNLWIRENIEKGLGNTKSLKSAIVLKEILDTPIGLR